MYGHPVQLSIDQDGGHHKTYIGGFISLLVQIGLLSYVVIIFYKMFTNGEDKNSSAQVLTKFEEIQDQSNNYSVRLNETKQIFFLAVRKDETIDMSFEELEKYLNFTAEVRDTDWNKPSHLKTKVTTHRMEPCTVEHFRYDEVKAEEMEQLFNSWKGFHILCLGDTDKMFLKGHKGENQTQDISFVVRKCKGEVGRCVDQIK